MWTGLRALKEDEQSGRSYSLFEAASYDPLPIGGIAVALMLGTYGLLGLSPDGPLLVLAACGTTLVYLGDRAVHLSPEDVYNCPGRLAWIRSHQGYLRGVALGAGALGLAMLPFLRPTTLILGSLLGMIGGAYVVPALAGGRRLKTFGLLKPFLVAAPWAVGAVALPVVEAGASFTLGVGALVVYRLCWILPNVLLSEWGDRAGDAAVGLQTAHPQWLAATLRGRASVWAVGGLIGVLGAVGWGGGPALLLVDAVGLFLLLGGVWMLRPDRSPRHAFVADLLVAWPIVTAVVAWVWG